MHGVQSKTFSTLFSILLLSLIASLATQTVFAAPITVTTGKTTYAAGDMLSVSGTATADALISIQVFDQDHVRKGIAQTTATAGGSYNVANVYKFTSKDRGGIWKVSVYDATSAETAEAGFTVAVAADVTPPILTLSIAPDKTVYGKETITITISADEALAAVSLTVTQTGASPSSVTLFQVIGDPAKWGGSYTVKTGYDGTVTIQASGRDLAENRASATAVFTVDATPPKLTITAPASMASATVTVSGTVDDETISTVDLAVGTSAPVNIDVTGLAWSTNVTLPTLGTHIMTASATDLAGNTGTATTSVILTAVEAPDIKGVAEAVTALKTDVSSLKSDVSGMSKKLADLEADLSKLKTDLSDIRSDVSSLKTDVSNIEDGISKMRVDLGSTTIETAGIRNDIAVLWVWILIAVILSLIAAVAAVLSVITVTRRVFLK